MRPRWTAAAATISLLSLTAAAPPADGSAAANSVPTWDRHYLSASAEGAHFEIRLAKIVKAHSRSADVKAIAARIAADHGRELLDLRRVAASLNVKLPQDPSIMQQHEIGNVARHSGAAFDRAYARLEVGDHIRDIEGDDAEQMEGSLPAAKAFAVRWSPMYHTHLDIFRKLAARIHAT